MVTAEWPSKIVKNREKSSKIAKNHEKIAKNHEKSRKIEVEFAIGGEW